MVIASDMRMHHMLIILTLTFIQGHTDQNHENNKYDYFRKYSRNAHQICCDVKIVIVNLVLRRIHRSGTNTVKIVQLKVYIAMASLMTFTFIHGHQCISNLTTF